MKKVKREGGGGLQDWLSYQSRTREVVRPETDTIDWDEGIEVQEEWLTREQCEQRLREEVERKFAPVAKSPPQPAPMTPVVEVEDIGLDIALASLAPTTTVSVAAPEESSARPIEIGKPAELATAALKAVESKAAEIKEASLPISREVKSKPAVPAQFETDDLASAVPAFHR